MSTILSHKDNNRASWRDSRLASSHGERIVESRLSPIPVPVSFEKEETMFYISCTHMNIVLYGSLDSCSLVDVQGVEVVVNIYKD